MHHGRACLVVRAIVGKPQEPFIVVQRLISVTPRPNCVLTRFGCRQLQRTMDPTAPFPELLGAPVSSVPRLEHVVIDFEDLSDRHGLRAFPDSTSRTARERLHVRFFINPFYPWTSSGLYSDGAASLGHGGVACVL